MGGGTWIGANLAFWLISAVVLVSALFAAFSRNVVTAAYSLFFTLFGMAGYYVLLGSGFLAITQVIVYVGGILVLLMFGVLLTDRPLTGLEQPPGNRLLRLAGGTLAIGLALIAFFQLFETTSWHRAETLAEPVEPLRALGRALLQEYLLVLETAGVTLLLCLFGAAYLVRREER